MKKPISFRRPVFAIILTTAVSISTIAGQEKSLADMFRTGKVRFIPELTITDKAMAGKDFFTQLSDLALDDQGCLYITDAKANNIKKFDAAGSYLGTIGKEGQGPGDFNYPAEIEFSRDRLYVRELMNPRISILDPGGHFIKSVPISFLEGQWQEMRALPDGRLVVQKEKSDIRDLNAPHEIFLDLYSSELDFIKTLYRHPIRRNKYITEPRRINVPIPFAPNVHWETTLEGKVIVGYSEKYELEIHDPDKGKIASFSHAYAPLEITDKDKEVYFQGMTVTFQGPGGGVQRQRGAPDYIVKNTDFPKHKPPFVNVKIDAEGNIWIQLYGLMISPEGPSMDVFDREGRALGKVRIERGGFFPYRMARLPKGFWTTRVDNDGEWCVVKYRISE